MGDFPALPASFNVGVAATLLDAACVNGAHSSAHAVGIPAMDFSICTCAGHTVPQTKEPCHTVLATRAFTAGFMDSMAAQTALSVGGTTPGGGLTPNTKYTSKYVVPTSLTVMQIMSNPALFAADTTPAPLVDLSTGEILRASGSCPSPSSSFSLGWGLFSTGNNAQQTINQTVSQTAMGFQSSSCTQTLVESNTIDVDRTAVCACNMQISQVIGGDGHVPTMSCDLSQNATAIQDALQTAVSKLTQSALTGMAQAANTSSQCTNQYISQAVEMAQSTSCNQTSKISNATSFECNAIGVDNTNATIAEIMGAQQLCVDYTQVNNQVPNLTCITQQVLKIQQTASQSAKMTAKQTSGPDLGGLIAIVIGIVIMVVAGLFLRGGGGKSVNVQTGQNLSPAQIAKAEIARGIGQDVLQKIRATTAATPAAASAATSTAPSTQAATKAA